MSSGHKVFLYTKSSFYCLAHSPQDGEDNALVIGSSLAMLTENYRDRYCFHHYLPLLSIVPACFSLIACNGQLSGNEAKKTDPCALPAISDEYGVIDFVRTVRYDENENQLSSEGDEGGDGKFEQSTNKSYDNDGDLATEVHMNVDAAVEHNLRQEYS